MRKEVLFIILGILIINSLDTEAAVACECVGDLECGAGYYCEPGDCFGGTGNGLCLASDTTGPSPVTITRDPSGTIYESQTVTYTATASDPSGINRITINAYGGPVGTTCFGTTTCIRTGGPYALGATVAYSATALDDSPLLNSRTSAPASFVIAPPPDTTNPVVGVSASPSSPDSNDEIIFTATATDANGISNIEIKLDGLLIKTCSSSPCISGSISGLSVGPHSYLATTTDTNGNSASDSKPLTVTQADTTPPTTSIDPNPSNPTSGDSVTLTSTATDSSGISQILIFVNSVQRKSCTSSPCNYANTYTTGEYQYYTKATDTIGNSITTSVETLTVSSTPPSDPPGTYDSEISPPGNCFCVFSDSFPNSPDCFVKTSGIPNGCEYTQSTCSGTIDSSCSCSFTPNSATSPISPYPSCPSISESTSCTFGYPSGLGDPVPGGGFEFKSSGQSYECSSRDQSSSCFRENNAVYPVLPGGDTTDLSCSKSLLTDGTSESITGTCSSWATTGQQDYGAANCVEICSTNSDCPLGLSCVSGSCNSCTSDSQCDSGEVCQGNRCVTSSCILSDVQISSNCGGSCDVTETISMSATISDQCRIGDNLQIDASTTGCDIQFIGGDLTGINEDVTINSGDTTVSALWTISSVPTTCKGKTVSAGASALRDNGPPGPSSVTIGSASATGSFSFKCDLTSQCPLGQGCNNGVCQSESCTNNIDDDLDGYIDCGDSDCNSIFPTATQTCTGSNKLGINSTDGNVYYCSYGFTETDASGTCCPSGQYWDGTGCTESICGNPILNELCHHDIGTPEYYADTTNCFQTTPIPYEQACCPVIRFGDLEERDFVNVVIS